MNIPKGMQVLLQGKTDFLQEIAQQMQAASIPVATGPIPGKHWESRAWLAVASADIERATKVHERHLENMVRREGLPVRNAHADFDAEETTCPACTTTFKTAGVTRCPECGLNFGNSG